MSKAFDRVNLDLLLQKLEHYGVRGIALELFKNYFRNRRQLVCVDEITLCDVPQGSIRGPLLFTYHIK